MKYSGWNTRVIKQAKAKKRKPRFDTRELFGEKITLDMRMRAYDKLKAKKKSTIF